MSFIENDFLLETKYAQELYFDYAQDLPIIDYHNHLSPELIAKRHHFRNLTEAWLDGDHYKWRALRTLGIDERYITGDAGDERKFEMWAKTVPYTLRNPLFHWTHLELKRYFDIDELLNTDTAPAIFEQTRVQLQQNTHNTVGLLRQQNVETVCTTDDPIDSLEHHKYIQSNKFEIQVLPTFRPDKLYAVEDTEKYIQYIERLAHCTGSEIKSYQDLINAAISRIQYFHAHGTRLSDHGLSQLNFYELGHYDCEKLFKKLLNNRSLSTEETNYFRFETLLHLCREYHKLGWVQQFHLGALRNTNTRMLRQLGADTGYDSIDDVNQARPLAQFLNALEETDQLSKTILYNLNPAYNEVMASMVANFNNSSAKGKVQYGSAWWFLDQLDGMTKQINSTSNLSLISCFIGMLTDSRSFLSFPRQEYFRRLLCNIFGNDIEKGLIPNDISFTGQIIKDICYYNAKNYFDFQPVDDEFELSINQKSRFTA